MSERHLSLTPDDVFRIVRDIFVDELSRSRPGSFDAGTAGAWTPETGVRDDGIGLDSLERFTVAGRLNETFGLYRSGVEDNLLRARTLGDTVDVVCAGLDHVDDTLSFYSGGTTGAARVIAHEAADLNAEVAELTALFPGRSRVVVTVPVHHIYGFLFGVLLPRALGVPVVDAQYSLLTGQRRPRNGDLVVSIPFIWERLLPQTARWGENVAGSSSTAPLPVDLARELTPRLTSLVEVYGSSETGGVGWRDHVTGAGEPFRLMQRWDRRGETAVVRPRDGADSVPVELPDRIRWLDDRRFVPEGRRDAVVQVGGINVDLDELRSRVLSLVPEAEDCALRLGSEGRLRLFLAAPNPGGLDREAIGDRLRRALPAVALPRSISVGAGIPRTPTGKLGDW